MATIIAANRGIHFWSYFLPGLSAGATGIWYELSLYGTISHRSFLLAFGVENFAMSCKS